MSKGENKERDFIKSFDREMNERVFKIMLAFLLVPVATGVLGYTGMFKLTVTGSIRLFIILLVVDLLYWVLLKFRARDSFIKYYAMLLMQIVICIAASNGNVGIYMVYILTPVLSCIYFDYKFTRNISIIGYLFMIITLFIRSADMVVITYTNYSRMQWFIAFGLGYTIEYLAMAGIALTIAQRAKEVMYKLFVRNEKVTEIQNQMIYSFADIIESRDESTGAHVKNTSRYVEIITTYLYDNGYFKNELTREYIDDMIHAAPLHDIGKIKVPDSILCKQGALDDEEYQELKKHTIEGQKIIEKTMAVIEEDGYVKVAKEMALFHHERFDGKGYPYGLKGEQIPLSARIMTVADVFDALRSERCYKKGMDIEEVLKIMDEGKGKQFEGVIVDALIESKDKLLGMDSNANKEIDDGE